MSENITCSTLCSKQQSTNTLAHPPMMLKALHNKSRKASTVTWWSPPLIKHTVHPEWSLDTSIKNVFLFFSKRQDFHNKNRKTETQVY